MWAGGFNFAACRFSGFQVGVAVVLGYPCLVVLKGLGGRERGAADLWHNSFAIGGALHSARMHKAKLRYPQHSRRPATSFQPSNTHIQLSKRQLLELPQQTRFQHIGASGCF